MAQVSLDALVTAARAGQLVGFPTDTVPALAARPASADLIYGAKQRSLQKSLILMADAPEQIWPYIQGSPAAFLDWQAIAARYWPGALTLVLPASDRVPVVMNRQTPDYIGVRVPDCAIAQEILARTGPLATTSINRSGQPALEMVTAIVAEFPDLPVLAESDWPIQLNPQTDGLERAVDRKPSTVVKWEDGQWSILRQGTIEFPI